MPQEEIYCHVFYAMKSLCKKHCMYFSKADDNNIGSICIICCSVSPLTHECMKWKLPLTKAIWSHQNCEETNLCNWEMIFVMLVFYYAPYLNSVLYSCFTVKSILQKIPDDRCTWTISLLHYIHCILRNPRGISFIIGKVCGPLSIKMR